MTNFSEKPTRRAWDTEPQLEGPLANFTIPGSTPITFYDGQAVGRDASGTLVQMDDTLKAEFIGFETDVIASSLTVNTTDSLGDKRGHIHRPYAFVALITSAAAGDEGRKVFWKYNNQVEYSTTQSNFAGTVLGVIDSTHVLVLAPWLRGITQGGDMGIYSTAAAAGTTLTKWDVNKVVLMPLTASEPITLPAAASLSPGDKITFINTSANSSTPTLTAAGADTINGAATYAQSTTQYSVAVLRTDGVSKWYVEVPGPSGTVGATTFSGNVAVSSATLVVTDNAAGTLAVGPNGSTNPCLSVDCSVSSAATGVNIIGRAAGAGVTLGVVSSGSNEDLLIAPKGTGGVKITSSSTDALDVGPNGATNPTLKVDASSASAATGLSITGAAAGSGLAIAVVSSGTNEDLTENAKGSGTITIGGISTGLVSIGRGSTNVAIFSSTKTSVSTQNATPTAAQLLGGYFQHATTTGAGTVTLDTAANIDAAIPGVATGDTFQCVYSNTGTQTGTITTATGLTLKGTVAVPSGKVAVLDFFRTGSAAWDVCITVSA
jgi:plastocyanin